MSDDGTLDPTTQAALRERFGDGARGPDDHLAEDLGQQLGEALDELIRVAEIKLHGHVHWMLKDGEPFETDPLTWAAWFETSGDERRVAETTVGEVWISTVFLAVDLQASLDRTHAPILWETAAFGPSPAGHSIGSMLDAARYTSKADALAGHRRMVDHYRQHQGEPDAPTS
jgi:hypothetical protein